MKNANILEQDKVTSVELWTSDALWNINFPKL